MVESLPGSLVREGNAQIVCIRQRAKLPNQQRDSREKPLKKKTFSKAQDIQQGTKNTKTTFMILLLWSVSVWPAHLGMTRSVK